MGPKVLNQLTDMRRLVFCWNDDGELHK
jgi:hypothetical protein